MATSKRKTANSQKKKKGEEKKIKECAGALGLCV